MMQKNKFIVFLTLVSMLLANACLQEQKQNSVTYYQYLSNGRDLYQKNCANCHGNQGEGLNQLYPPLTDTLYMSQQKKQIACFIKEGIKGKKIYIGQKEYNENMPANKDLQDIDIAQIIVYITNNFGNKQGFYSYQQVSNDLKNCETHSEK